MGSFTPNLNLYKPADTEEVDVERDLNENYDKIDTGFDGVQNAFNDMSNHVDNQLIQITDQVDTIAHLGEWDTYTPQLRHTGGAAPTPNAVEGHYASFAEVVYYRVFFYYSSPTVVHSTNDLVITLPTDVLYPLSLIGRISRGFGNGFDTLHWAQRAAGTNEMSFGVVAGTVEAVTISGSYRMDVGP